MKLSQPAGCLPTVSDSKSAVKKGVPEAPPGPPEPPPLAPPEPALLPPEPWPPEPVPPEPCWPPLPDGPPPPPDEQARLATSAAANHGHASHLSATCRLLKGGLSWRGKELA